MSDAPDLEKEQYLRQYEAGKYMKSLRGDRSLASVVKELGISTNYLSEVERGKLPSELFLSKAATLYGVDEDDLYYRWGVVPIIATQVIKDNKELLSTLAEIGRNTKLDQEQRDRLYKSILMAYRDFMSQIASEKEGASL